MLRYIIRRLLYAVLILISVSLVTFVLFYASSSPQQIARRNLSAKNPTPQQIEEVVRRFGVMAGEMAAKAAQRNAPRR